MKGFICLILLSGCLAFLTGKEDEETKEFLDDFSQLCNSDNSSMEEIKKKITDFVNKYGKTRVCKHMSKEWKRNSLDPKAMNDLNKSLKNCCEDEKQGDKELIQVFIDGVKQAHEQYQFDEDLKNVNTAIKENKEAVKALTNFVKKYGKTRICKNFEAGWKREHSKMSGGNETTQKSCNDDKQGEKEFLQVLKDVYIKQSKASS